MKQFRPKHTIGGMLCTALLALAGTPAQAQSCTAANLWVNGTFENAAVGNYCNIFNPVNNHSAASPFFGFTTFTWTAGASLQPTYVNEATIDHTTGAAGGHYLYVDPRANTGATHQVRQSIKVKAGTTYTFSAWLCSMLKSNYSTAPAVVQLYVNGSSVSSSLTLNSTSLNGWQQLSGTWTAAATGYVNVEIVAFSPVIGGHDFAIDDISFSAGTLQVEAGQPAKLCVGDQYTLGGAPTADFGATCNSEYTYSWSPAINLSATNVANPVFTATVPASYVYTVTVTDKNGNTCSDNVSVSVNKCTSVCAVPNLWVNGTFENAAVNNHCNIFNPVNNYSAASPYFGFTTFTWTAGASLQPSFVNEASIDHTTGAAGGHYLYVDPRAATGAAYQVRQSIKVKAGTTYTFSAWLCSMINTSHASAPAVVQLYVNGAAVSSSTTLSSTTPNGWQQLSGSWTAASTGPVDVEIVAFDPVIGGHDFAIDDIFFGAGDIEVDAGVNATICVKQNHTLGGNPTADFGATCNSEYTYNWTPTTGIITASNIANPVFNIGTPGTYTYTVSVTDLNGNVCTDKVTINVRDCKAATRLMQSDEQPISAYPNPFSHTLTFRNLPGAETVTISVFNINGQRMMSRMHTGSSYSMDLSGLSSGIYYYIITAHDGSVLHKDKVIKQ